jgi:hypothetical protein
VRIHRLVAAVALALTACGGNGGGGSSPLTISGAWERYVRVDCAKGHECRDSYPGADADFVYDYGVSVADCTTELQDPEFAAAVNSYEAAAADGRLSYDAGKAKTCFDAWAAQGCAAYWRRRRPEPGLRHDLHRVPVAARAARAPSPTSASAPRAPSRR